MRTLKYKIIKVLLLVYLLVNAACDAYSQNADEDLNKIKLKYQQVEKIMINKTINYYENYNDNEPIRIEKTVLKKTKNQLYTKSNNVETVINKGFSALVDHKTKTILLDENDQSEFQESLEIDFTAIRELSSKVTFKKNKNDAYYTFHFKDDEYLKAELWFEKETYNVKKVIFFLQESLSNKEKKAASPVKVETVITEMKTNCDFKANTFALEQFVRGTDKGLEPIQRYKDYKVINNIGY